MRVLIIDDEPIRAQPVIEAGHDIRIAHGYEQVKFWLRNKHWIPEMVCLDNDMPLMSGLEVAKLFADDLFYLPVRVWSRNNIAGPKIRDILLDHAKQLGLEDETEIVVRPFDSKIEASFWK